MSVAFICGNLEPGCDGVGDYARQLAAEIIRQGPKACLISLADRTVLEIVEQRQDAGGMEVLTLRIPETLPWKERIFAAQRFMSSNGLEKVSFQFVCWSYSPKGMIHEALPFLLRVAAGKETHVMFHELWLGEAIGSSFKHRIVGALQRHFITKLIRGLAPSVVHTSNPAYLGMLSRVGVAAQLLPLFGNIQMQEDAGSDEAARMFHAQGIDLSPPGRSQFWIGAIFGAIHPEWDPTPFFDELGPSAEREGKTVVIAGIGRFGAEGDRVWAEMVRAYGGRVRFLLFGAQSAETVSRLLQAVDFGLSTTPWQLFGKSSTGASMTDHGLPVVVTRDDWKSRRSVPIETSISPLAVRFARGAGRPFKELLALRRAPASSRVAVAAKFIAALSLD